MAPFATVQRAQIVLLAHRHPEWQNALIAQQVGCQVNTVKRWRQRGPRTDSLRDAPRAGTRHTFTPLQRAQVVALACSAPRQYGKPWQRWSGEVMQVAVEQHIVATIAPGRSAVGCGPIRQALALSFLAAPTDPSLSRKPGQC
jgi:hypothetical protein